MKPLILKKHSVLIEHCPIIKDIDLELEMGEVITILGPNGSGKSTLLHSLMGTLNSKDLKLVCFDSHLMGKGLMDFSLQKKAEIMTAVLQRPEIHPQLTVRQYFEFSKPDQKIDPVHFEEIVSFLQLKPLLNRTLGTLSGGEFKKVAIGAALYQETKIVLLDEPFQALDPKSKEVVGHTINFFKSHRDVSFVIAAHDFYWAKHLADKALLLKRGESVAYGKAEDVLTVDNLSKTFGMEFSRYQNEEGEDFIYPRGKE